MGRKQDRGIKGRGVRGWMAMVVMGNNSGQKSTKKGSS
jgi:hypothetical protein